MKIELVNAIPELESTYKEIIFRAINESLITEEEWNNRFKNYRDDCGYSFIHYLESIFGKCGVFVTSNPLMLDNREELEERFGVKIMTLEEAVKYCEESEVEENE